MGTTFYFNLLFVQLIYHFYFIGEYFNPYPMLFRVFAIECFLKVMNGLILSCFDCLNKTLLKKVSWDSLEIPYIKYYLSVMSIHRLSYKCHQECFKFTVQPRSTLKESTQFFMNMAEFYNFLTEIS